MVRTLHYNNCTTVHFTNYSLQISGKTALVVTGLARALDKPGTVSLVLFPLGLPFIPVSSLET